MTPRIAGKKRRCAYHGCQSTTIYACGLCLHHLEYVRQGDPQA